MSYVFDALNRFLNQQKSDASADGSATGPSAQGFDDAPRDTPVYSGGEPSVAQPAVENEQPFRENGAPVPFPIDLHNPRIETSSLTVDDRLVTVSQPSSTMAEEYRSIRTGMLARWDQKRNLIHTVTSATPREGKTITSLNLGFTFAELRNRRVAVVEADLRLPLFKDFMALPSQPGLVSLLEGKVALSQAVHRLADDRLHVISAGRRVNNQEAVGLLSSSAMVSLVQTLRKKYDHVIIDTPPVIELADAGILGSISDEVLLIVRMNRTPRPLVEQAIRTLVNYNVTIGGMIATDHQRPTRRYYYSYKYGQGYSYQNSSVDRKAA